MFESCRAHHKIKRSKDLRRSVAGLRRRRDLLVLTQKVCREYKWVIFRERRGMIRDSPAERTPRALTKLSNVSDCARFAPAGLCVERTDLPGGTDGYCRELFGSSPVGSADPTTGWTI